MRRKTDPVTDAILLSDSIALQKALSDGHDFEKLDRDGRAAIAQAVISGEPKLVEMLLRAGAKVNTSDDQGFTPLHHAAQRHSLEIVRLLLDAGASVNQCDVYGNTALFRAVFESRGRKEVVWALLKAGADASIKNKSGVSARELVETIANYDLSGLFPGR